MTDVQEAAGRALRPVDTVRMALERMKPQMQLALPRHLTADRLVRIAMSAIQQTPKLLECDRTSLYAAIFACAQLGLEPDGILGQAYLVPFAGRCQLIPGYKGLISLARNSGDVTSIAAHEVRDRDKFEFDFASGAPPSHTFDIRQKRGDVIAFYAIARFKDGSFHWDMMTREEVERIRDGSQGYKAAVGAAKRKDLKSPETPWTEHFVEMGKKTMIRRIAKYLPMSVQKAAALADSYDIGRHVHLDKHGEIVIEGAVVEEEGAPEIERQQSKLEQFEDTHGESTRSESEPPTEQLPLDASAGRGRQAR